MLKRYSHVVFRMVKKLRKGEGRTNIMAKLGRALGPFGSARAAYDAATTAGLKLGMSVEELELYMTLERVILKGPRKPAARARSRISACAKQRFLQLCRARRTSPAP